LGIRHRKQGAILSEQFPPEAAPPEEEITALPAELSEPEEPESRRDRSGWIVPAWFLFGILVGIIGFAAYNALTVKPLDSATVRDSARAGTLDAIATLQAGGGQQEPQAVADNAFTVRDTNRQGAAGAPVTIFEFSDFQ
jgi:hypothetical protein